MIAARLNHCLVDSMENNIKIPKNIADLLIKGLEEAIQHVVESNKKRKKQIFSEELENIKNDKVYDMDGLLNIVPVCRGTVYKEIKKGRLKFVKIGRRVVFLDKDVKKWLMFIREDSR